MSDYFETPRTIVRWLICPWNSPDRLLEWVAISFSKESSRPRDWTNISCNAGRFFSTVSPGKPILREYTLLIWKHFWQYSKSKTWIDRGTQLQTCAILQEKGSMTPRLAQRLAGYHRYRGLKGHSFCCIHKSKTWATSKSLEGRTSSHRMFSGLEM